MPFGSLWLPVVVSAVAVWLLSAVLHMVLKYHRADYKPLPNEDAVGAALGHDALAPGLYAIPYCVDGAAMKDPAVQEKYKRGPVALIAAMRPGPPAMGKTLGLWLLFCFLVSFVAAYLARHTLTPATAGLLVMQVTGTVAFVGYGFGAFQDSIWHGIPWSNAVRSLIDSALYAVLTGAIFWGLWPGA
jgi:hypothetical protein